MGGLPKQVRAASEMKGRASLVALGIAILSMAFVAFCIIWRADGRSTLIFSPYLIFSINEFVLVWPSAIRSISIGLSEDMYGVLLVAVGYTSFLVGYAVIRSFLYASPSEMYEFQAKPIESESGHLAWFLAFVVTATALIASGLLLYQGVPPVTVGVRDLFAGIAGDDVARFVGESRKQITKGHYFGGAYRGQGLLRTIGQIGWPYLLGMAIIQYEATKRRIWLGAAAFTGVFCFMFVAGDGTRNPFLTALLYLVVLASLVRKVNPRALAMGGVGIVGVAILLSAISPKMHGALGGGRFFSIAAQRIAERILFGNGTNNIYTIEFVRSGRLQLHWGAIHLRDAMNAIPGVMAGLPFAHELHLLLNPGSTATTYENGTYLMTIYADFGAPGVFLVYALIGCFIGWICTVVFRSRKSASTLAMISWCSILAGKIAISGFTGFLASVVVLFCIHSLTHTIALCLQPKRLNRYSGICELDRGSQYSGVISRR
jgi:hypothetical protein